MYCSEATPKGILHSVGSYVVLSRNTKRKSSYCRFPGSALKKNQKGGVFKRNSSRGHELRIFVDGDPDNVVDFFEEYEGFKRGYPRRRSVYYLPDKESAIEPLIPEFIHISQKKMET